MQAERTRLASPAFDALTRDPSWLYGCRGQVPECLAYARWLRENGDPTQAELLEVEVALSAVPARPRKEKLEARRDALLNEIEGAWLAALRSGVDACNLVRAVCRVKVTTRTFVTKAFQQTMADLFARPAILVLRLTRPGRSLAKAVHSPLLAHSAALDLNGAGVTDEGAAMIAGSGSLDRLATRILLRNNEVTHKGVLALGDFLNVTVFSVTDNGGEPIFDGCECREHVENVIEYRFVNKGDIPPTVTFRDEDGHLYSARWDFDSREVVVEDEY